LKDHGNLLSRKEQKVLTGLGDSSLIAVNTANMSEEYFLTRHSIINKIHRHVVRTAHQISKR